VEVSTTVNEENPKLKAGTGRVVPVAKKNLRLNGRTERGSIWRKKITIRQRWPAKPRFQKKGAEPKTCALFQGERDGRKVEKVLVNEHQKRAHDP